MPSRRWLPGTQAVGSVTLLGMAAVWGSLIMLGCGANPAGRGSESFATRDSAGILIADNAGAAVRNAPALRLVEDLRIGAVTGNAAEEFFGLQDLAIGEHGEIFALDSRARTVREFARDGTPLREFGRPGRGPGEFSGEPYRLTVAGDTVLVQDRARFYLFAADGQPRSTIPQRITGNARPAVLAHGVQGWVMGELKLAPVISDQRRTVRDTFRVWPLHIDSARLGPPILEAPTTLRRYLADERSVFQWFGPQVAATVRANGEIYYVDGDDYEIRVLSPEGRLVREMRAEVERQPLKAGDLEAALRRYQESSRFTIGIAEWRELGPPAFKPVPGRLLVAPGGRLLVERRDLGPVPLDPDDSTPWTWDLLSPEGRILGRMTVDRRINLQVLTDSALYAIARDELDVQYIVRYRIVPVGDGKASR